MPKRIKCAVPGCEEQGDGAVLFQFPKNGKPFCDLKKFAFSRSVLQLQHLELTTDAHHF